MLAAVDALLPLSLLEAVRHADTPSQEELDAELVDELRNKRLGLSDTVYSQIKRYTDAMRRRQRIPPEEALALARLVGRRPDAEDVFREAGRFLAREGYKTISPTVRGMLRGLPSIVARPLALRRVRSLSARFLNGQVKRVGSAVMLEIDHPITAGASADGTGCVYPEAFLRELLYLLIGSTGAVEHVRCRSRGEPRCEWRADWTAISRAAA
jgi:predicted hydrocarbon binding protein